MNRATKLALAAAAPVAALAMVGHPAAAAPPPIEPPSPVSSADLVVLTDDTGTITVAVPISWTDVDTTPDAANPWISAAPDYFGFVSTFDVPGVTFEAVPYTPDTESLAHDHGYAMSCAGEELQPYDDGLFTGSHLTDTGCGHAGTAAYHVVAANPGNQAFTALIDIQISEPDQASIVDGILNSFNLTDDAWAAGAPARHAKTAGDVADPAAPPAVLEAPTSTAADSSLGGLQELVDSLGLTLTAEQATCLASGPAQLDPNDVAAAVEDPFDMPPSVLLTLLNCGVDVFDIPSG